MPSILSSQEYFKRLKKKGFRIALLEKYGGVSEPLKHRCNMCDLVWKVRPENLIYPGNGHACSFPNRLKNHKTFLRDLKGVHGNRYKPLEKYRGCGIKLKIFDRECGTTWKIIPSHLLSGRGCPKCNRPREFSNKAISWLKMEAKERKIRIRHAGNWGEYIIPETQMRVDGFHKKSNTIFEFYGDAFHGNLKKYKPYSRPHPYSNTFAKDLYNQVKEREKKLKKLGYNLVTMWENNFRERHGTY